MSHWDGTADAEMWAQCSTAVQNTPNPPKSCFSETLSPCIPEEQWRRGFCLSGMTELLLCCRVPTLWGIRVMQRNPGRILEKPHGHSACPRLLFEAVCRCTQNLFLGPIGFALKPNLQLNKIPDPLAPRRCSATALHINVPATLGKANGT